MADRALWPFLTFGWLMAALVDKRSSNGFVRVFLGSNSEALWRLLSRVAMMERKRKRRVSDVAGEKTGNWIGFVIKHAISDVFFFFFLFVF